MNKFRNNSKISAYCIIRLCNRVVSQEKAIFISKTNNQIQLLLSSCDNMFKSNKKCLFSINLISQKIKKNYLDLFLKKRRDFKLISIM